MKKWIIIDWMSNICFNGVEFDSFDDGEEFLCEELGDNYEIDRQEYYVVEKGEIRDGRYLEANDIRNRKKLWTS